MSSGRTADVIVVGLGAAGSAALWHLAARGVDVIGLDRFDPPHVLGSTHGGSRIIRRAYFEGSQYHSLLTRAYELWEVLEQQMQERLISWCGCLNVAPAGSEMIQAIGQNAARAKVEVDLLTPGQVQEVFPAYRLQADEVALFESQAGAIDPERAVQAHLDQARAKGARILVDEPILSWTLSQHDAVVRTPVRTLSGGALIVTAGAWMRALLGRQSPPVQVERVVNAWFSACGADFEPTRFPTFIWQRAGTISYGFPNFGDGLKAGLHHEGSLSDTPLGVDKVVHRHEVDRVRALMTNFFGPLGPDNGAAVCLYTNTPDKHYLMDYLYGTERRIVVGSACSGHGFKSSAAVGEVLADLAMQRRPSVAVEPFRWRWP